MMSKTEISIYFFGSNRSYFKKIADVYAIAAFAIPSSSFCSNKLSRSFNFPTKCGIGRPQLAMNAYSPFQKE